MSAAAGGACCRQNIPNGSQCIIISDAGVPWIPFPNLRMTSWRKSGSGEEKLHTPRLALLTVRVPGLRCLAPKRALMGTKKVKGVKRNIITDKDGDILEASTTPANIHDSKSAYAIVAMLVVALPWIRRIYADRGYRGNFIEEARHDFGIDVEITHSNYSGKFVTAKKRWVVERTFAWLENFRRLCRNYEVTTESANEMLMVAAVVITPPQTHLC